MTYIFSNLNNIQDYLLASWVRHWASFIWVLCFRVSHKVANEVLAALRSHLKAELGNSSRLSSCGGWQDSSPCVMLGCDPPFLAGYCLKTILVPRYLGLPNMAAALIKACKPK